MKELANIEKKETYRVTIIFKDEISVVKFFTLETATETVKLMKELFPRTFVGGAIEEKKKKWEVIQTFSSIKAEE